MSRLVLLCLVSVLSAPAWGAELPGPDEPLAALNGTGTDFLCPTLWTFWRHFLTMGNLPAKRLVLGEAASYFQDGASHRAREEIDARRPFCKLALVAGAEAGARPAAELVLRRNARIYLADRGVTTREVPGSGAAAAWVETTVRLGGNSTNDDFPGEQDAGLERLWGFVCRSPAPLSIAEFARVVGLHVYHKGFNPLRLIAAARIENERAGVTERESAAAPAATGARSPVAAVAH